MLRLQWCCEQQKQHKQQKEQRTSSSTSTEPARAARPACAACAACAAVVLLLLLLWCFRCCWCCWCCLCCFCCFYCFCCWCCFCCSCCFRCFCCCWLWPTPRRKTKALRQKCIMISQVIPKEQVHVDCAQCFLDSIHFLWFAEFIGARNESLQITMLVMWLQRRDVPSAFHSACHTRCAFSGVMWVKSATCTHGSALHLWGFSGRQWPRSVRAPRALPKRGCSAGGLQLWLWGCR